MLGSRFSCALLLLPGLAAQTGIITTIAGKSAGFSGDGGTAVNAALALANLQNQCPPLISFEQTSHIAVDGKGNLYVADSNNQRIRRIDPSGLIITIAGDGTAPTCSPFAAASPHLFNPADILPLPDGILIADQQNNRIVQIASSGAMTTVAGNGIHNFFAPGNLATASPMDWPSALAADAAGNIYFAELHSNRIGRITGGTAGGKLAVVANPLIVPSELNKPAGIAIDREGNVLIADTGNHRIRKATPAGALTTIAGTGSQSFCGDGGPALNACFDTPMDVKLDSRGNIYVADAGNHRVRRIDAATNSITTVAGTGVAGRGPDAVAATSSALNYPCAIALDVNNDLYIVDWQNYLIRRVSFPAFTSAAIVDGAAFSVAPSPGGIFTIFGVSLSASTAAFATVPLPTQLAGISLEINGAAVPLYLVSPTQINAQLPFDTLPGPATAVLVTSAGRTAPVTFTVAPAAPAVFVAFAQTGIITAYVTGLGAVSPAVPTGAPAPLDMLSNSLATVSATIGGVPAGVQFAGLAPGFVGLGQVNVLIPPDAPKGDAVPLILKINDQTSKPTPVAIH